MTWPQSAYVPPLSYVVSAAVTSAPWSLRLSVRCRDGDIKYAAVGAPRTGHVRIETGHSIENLTRAGRASCSSLESRTNEG